MLMSEVRSKNGSWKGQNHGDPGRKCQGKNRVNRAIIRFPAALPNQPREPPTRFDRLSSLCLFRSLPWGEHNPEPERLVQLGRESVAAVRRPAVPGLIVPAAAAKHAVQARGRPLRVNGSAGGIRAIPVLAPPLRSGLMPRTGGGYVT